MLSFASRRFCAGLIALAALAACAPQPPPQNPTGHTEQPQWHVAPYAVDRTPFLWRDVVFAVATPAGGARSHAYAFDRANGRLRWASTFAVDRILGVFDGRVYVREANSERNDALDATTGAKRPFDGRALGAMTEGRSGRFYAVAHGDTLVVIDAAGRTIRQRSVPVELDADVAPVLAGGTVAVFGSRENNNGATLHGVYAFDAATGAERWQAETRNALGASTSYDVRSILGDERNVYTNYFVQVPGRDFWLLVARDAVTGAERWRRERFVSCADAPATLAPGRIFACMNASGHGGLYAEIDGKTGATLRTIHTAALYPGDVIADGSLFASDESPYQMLNEAGSYSYYRWLTRIDLRTGKELWRSPVQTEAAFTPPVANDGYIIVGSRYAGNTPPADPTHAQNVNGLFAWKYPHVPPPPPSPRPPPSTSP